MEPLIKNSRVLVLGGGLAGLSAAYHLKHSCTVLDRNHHPGGLLKTVHYGDFYFDIAPHIFFTSDEYARRLFEELLGIDQVIVHESDARVFTHNRLTQFPFQCSLYGLPFRVKIECLMGLLKAKFSKINTNPSDFRQWVLSTFGEGIANYFMFPYNTKLWGELPEDLTSDWVGNKVIQPSLRETFEGAFLKRTYKRLPNREFRYPSSGGILTLARAFASEIDNLLLGANIVELDLPRKVAKTTSSGEFSFQTAIWTLPLTMLPALIKDLPEHVANAARALKYRRVTSFHVGVDRPDIASWHWMYFAEDQFPFFRVSFPGNMSPAMVPKGKSSLIAEVATPSSGHINLKKMRQEVISGLTRAGLLRGGEKLSPLEVITMDPAYVVYNHDRVSALRVVFEYFESNSIVPAGRFGEWSFFNMDHTILSGKRAASKVDRILES